jgi:hypothetical protein
LYIEALSSFFSCLPEFGYPFLFPLCFCYSFQQGDTPDESAYQADPQRARTYADELCGGYFRIQMNQITQLLDIQACNRKA